MAYLKSLHLLMQWQQSRFRFIARLFWMRSQRKKQTISLHALHAIYVRLSPKSSMSSLVNRRRESNSTEDIGS